LDSEERKEESQESSHKNELDQKNGLPSSSSSSSSSSKLERELDKKSSDSKLKDKQISKKVVSEPSALSLIPQNFSFGSRKKQRIFENDTPQDVQGKILKLLQDIEENGLSIKGGKRVPAEWNHKDYYSFRLNNHDRLVLKQEGERYLILDFQGHYNNDRLLSQILRR
jgi:Txe/YoeB family toxin of Txe-Axe toxin-antitoxin module